MFDTYMFTNRVRSGDAASTFVSVRVSAFSSVVFMDNLLSVGSLVQFGERDSEGGKIGVLP
jgi:hypothetical protein